MSTLPKSPGRKPNVTAIARIRGLWLRAAGSGKDGVTIQCENRAEAEKLRFAMYRAVKDVRQDYSLDEELAEVLNLYQASLWPPETKHCVRIAPNTTYALIEKAVADLGIDESTLDKPILSREELDAQASLERLQRMLAEDADADKAHVERPKNPYYTRED